MPASATTKGVRFTRIEDIVLVEALHKMLNDFDCSRGPKWATLAETILRVCGHQHSGPHIRNQICRLIFHLFDRNADAMINAYRRPRTFNSIRSALFASSLPNGTYPDAYDTQKFKLQVEAAAEKVSGIVEIRWSDYDLPDLFNMIKKTPSDVKEWLEGALKRCDSPEKAHLTHPVKCKTTLSQKGVGMAFEVADAEETDADEFEEDDEEKADADEENDEFAYKNFEDEDADVGGTQEQRWLKDRSDAIQAMFKMAGSCCSTPALEQLAQNLADFIKAGPDADYQTLIGETDPALLPVCSAHSLLPSELLISNFIIPCINHLSHY